MIKFGTSGNGEYFYNKGFKTTLDGLFWLKEIGLKAYEYSFGRGFNISEETATNFGKEFAKHDIEISVHAPYFINFASPDEQKVQNSYNYILHSLKLLRCFGGKRCVFHVGSCGKQPREEAFRLTKERIETLIKIVKESGYGDMILCPETMGKSMQIGTYKEIAEICNIDDMLIPTLDFGHINALTNGSLKSSEDFEEIIKYMIENIGFEKTQKTHIHFSKIEYSAKGEIRHLIFEDTKYGPEYEHLAVIIKKYNLQPHIICESNGTQTIDAVKMLELQNKINLGIGG